MPEIRIETDFATFVANSYKSLVRYGVMVVGDVTRAEDLVQSALIKTGLAWSRIEPSRAESYTRRVMARAAWKQARRRWNREIPTLVLPEPSSHDRDEFAIVDSADSVRRALSQLPTDQRLVLTLRYFDELSEAEIAHVLRCPPGTVKSRAARGLEKLRLLAPLSEQHSRIDSQTPGAEVDE